MCYIVIREDYEMLVARHNNCNARLAAARIMLAAMPGRTVTHEEWADLMGIRQRSYNPWVGESDPQKAHTRWELRQRIAAGTPIAELGHDVQEVALAEVQRLDDEATAAINEIHTLEHLVDATIYIPRELQADEVLVKRGDLHDKRTQLESLMHTIDYKTEQVASLRSGREISHTDGHVPRRTSVALPDVRMAIKRDQVIDLDRLIAEAKPRIDALHAEWRELADAMAKKRQAIRRRRIANRDGYGLNVRFRSDTRM